MNIILIKIPTEEEYLTSVDITGVISYINKIKVEYCYSKIGAIN